MIVKIKYVGGTPISPEVGITPGAEYVVLGWSGKSAIIQRDDGEAYVTQNNVIPSKWEIVSVTEGGCQDHTP